jgi:hypothetical protein
VTQYLGVDAAVMLLLLLLLPLLLLVMLLSRQHVRHRRWVLMVLRGTSAILVWIHGCGRRCINSMLMKALDSSGNY